MAEELVLNIDYDISAAEMKQKKLDAEFEEAKKKAAETGEQVMQMQETLVKQKKNLEQINQQYDEQLKKVQEINTALANEQNISKQFELQNTRDKEMVKLAELAGKQTTYKNKVEETQIALEKANTAHDKANEKLTNIAIKEKQVAEKAQEINAAQSSMPPALSKAGMALDKFSKRIIGLAKRVFIFSVITMALRKLRKAISDMIGQDSELQQYVKQIKGNFAVMGRTLFESMRPVIEWLLQKIAYLTQLLAVILAKVLRKDVKQMADMAKSSAKTAKNAERTTAAFDTLQKIDTTKNNNDSDNGASFEQFDVAGWTDEQLAKIMAIAGTAMIAVGLILCFFGHIGLGVAAIAAGVAMLYTAARMSNEMEGKTKQFVTTIMGIAGGALLVLGIILCATGVAIPLGIAAIVIGVGMLVGAAVLNWDFIKDNVGNVLNKIGEIASKALLAIGIILCLSGVGLPIGLGLLAAGAKGLKATNPEDYEALITKVKEITDKIKAIVYEMFNRLPDGMKGFINKVISGINWLVEKINNIIAKVNGISIGGFSPNLPYIPYVPYLNVPKLAKGAVIAGGSPFLAMLGDQPRGQTNIETPLETMIEAFKAAQSETNVNIEFTGSLAQLARVLNPQIKKEQKRASIW